MVDIQKAVIPALLIPLLLVIFVSVYMSTTDSTSYAFETAVAAEGTGTTAASAAGSAYTVSHCKDASVTAVANGSTAMTVVTGYNVTYSPLGVANITYSEDLTGGEITATYTAYKGDGYTAFDKMNDQTYSSFKIASIMPYVLVAMVVLSIVLTGLAIV